MKEERRKERKQQEEKKEDKENSQEMASQAKLEVFFQINSIIGQCMVTFIHSDVLLIEEEQSSPSFRSN